MSKKIIISLVVIIILVIAGGFFWWWQDQAEVRELNKNLPEGVRVILTGVRPLGKAEEEKLTGVRPLEKTEIGQEIGQRNPELTREEKLAQIQKMLDEIAERIDILSQKIEETQGQRLTRQRNETEEIEEDEEEAEELEEETTEEREEDEVCRVNINTASKKELQKITGIGTVIAQRIIEARPFYSLNDLVKVKGIGPITLQRIIVQGCAYVEVAYRRTGGDGAGIPAPAETLAETPPKILISEVKIAEERGDKNVFIELYNENNFEVDLTGWYIFRNDRSFITKTLLENKKIASKQHFLLVKEGSDKYNKKADVFFIGTLNEDDKISLKNPNEKITDEVFWQEIPINHSFGRKWIEEKYQDINNNAQDFEIQLPTPKARNQSLPLEEEIEKIGVRSLSVVINEIAWMGTEASSSDEWIEFYNNTASPIDIVGWRLVSSDQKPDIIFSTTTGAVTTIIPVQGFYLIERTNNDTTSEPANWIGSFGSGIGMGLGNNPNCEVLSLFDQNENLIDQTVCLEKGNWPAGSAGPGYISMERIDPAKAGSDPANWANNNLITRNGWTAEKEGQKYPINGTPRAKNSVSKSQNESSQGQVKNWQGEKGQDKVISLTFDGTYLYAGLETAPAKVIKIDPSDMTTKGIWTAQFFEIKYARSLTFDGNYLYASLGPGGVAKINTSNYLMEVVATWTEAGANWYQEVAYDGRYVLAGLHLVPTKVVGIDFSTPTPTAKEIWQGTKEDNAVRALIYANNYIYIGLGSSPGKIIKKTINK